MASIQKRGPAQYPARVRRTGVHKALTRTFETKQEAERWARKMEADLDAGKRILFLATPEAQSLTLRSALERYRDEKTVAAQDDEVAGKDGNHAL